MNMKRIPRLGVAAVSLPGLFFGEELSEPKYKEMLNLLEKFDYEIVPSSKVASSPIEAREIGKELNEKDIDCVLVVVTTFVADYYITELIDVCRKPVFLWVVERELHCISLVCGPLITASLVNLGYDFYIAAGDIGDQFSLEKLEVFAKACMMKNLLAKMRVGYTGGKPIIMFSMAADEFVIKKKLGTTVVNFPIEEFYDLAESISSEQAEKKWNEIKSSVGNVRVNDIDGIESTKNYFAVKELIDKYALDAISINCFPYLKAKICMAIAMLNDELIGAGCEGDLHATILMRLIESISEKAAFNGDFLKLYPEKNEIMFSHCGAGGFTLSGGCKNISLCASAETNDGLGVFYQTRMTGTVTLVNLMTEPGGLRMAVMSGESVADDSGYCGNPLRLLFSDNVRDILQNVSKSGAGHHWMGIEGDYVECFKILSDFLKIPFTVVGK